MDDHACLPLCSFAHICEGRSLQAVTPELAYATHACPYQIGCRSGMPCGRLIPRGGMLTNTGPLATMQAGLHLCDRDASSRTTTIDTVTWTNSRAISDVSYPCAA
uniref:Uncharacterized protein n=1 Tax=Ananas comosus var. bracteatus TaxID=296719 RepID=A0A6V7NYC1_ANACO|nr:unnamed protein product [Ananas comosus var. bracteatus]